MTLIICDSSFIILISKLEVLDLLIDKFDRIMIPKEVYIESVERGKKLKKMDAFLIEERVKEKKIIVQTINDVIEKKRLMHDFNIHEGEAGAIVLYLEKKGELFGTDDSRTIRTCKIFNIKYFTTPLFLGQCFVNNLITQREFTLKLEKLKQFGWYKEEIISEFFNNIIKEDKNGESNFSKNK
jgi:predicted nucleic acid-binding protein